MSDISSHLHQAVDDLDPPPFEPETMRRKASTAHRLRQLATIGFAVAVAASGLLASLVVFRGGPAHIRPAATGADYYLTMPAEVKGPDSSGGFVIDATTNLPDGTNAWASYTNDQAGGSSCCYAVKAGQLEIHVSNGDCQSVGGKPQSIPFTVEVIVAPSYDAFLVQQIPSPGQSPSAKVWQPSSVTDVLGSDFSELHGAQVQEQGGMNVLKASQSYTLPSSSCP